MVQLLERLIGANWRTTLTGYGTAILATLAALAAAPYELGDLATIIPPEWKARLFAVSAAAAFVLKLVNAHVSKDAVVSGGTILHLPPGPSRIVESSRERLIEAAGRADLVVPSDDVRS